MSPLPTGRVITKFRGHDNEGMTDRFVPGTADHTVPNPFRELSDSLGEPVNCIALSNDGNCLLASCLDSTLRLIDRTTGGLLQEYKGHKCKIFKAVAVMEEVAGEAMAEVVTTTTQTKMARPTTLVEATIMGIQDLIRSIIDVN
ncbi:hypothetical protein QQ045_027133 [Rhodiola kirilowii]